LCVHTKRARGILRREKRCVRKEEKKMKKKGVVIWKFEEPCEKSAVEAAAKNGSRVFVFPCSREWELILYKE